MHMQYLSHNSMTRLLNHSELGSLHLVKLGGQLVASVYVNNEACQATPLVSLDDSNRDQSLKMGLFLIGRERDAVALRDERQQWHEEHPHGGLRARGPPPLVARALRHNTHSPTHHQLMRHITDRSSRELYRIRRVEVRGVESAPRYCATRDVDGGRARARSRAQPSFPRDLTL
ncbi:unnamed protein product [Euphydryas editha]|uniref:Uncharacterized protein n=1 Tax=Euphydryas editha TaxID=104508 RepID=A0AAU9TI15_EUPED|nr:unnamed protein product [Euphydryas editha]